MLFCIWCLSYGWDGGVEFLLVFDMMCYFYVLLIVRFYVCYFVCWGYCGFGKFVCFVFGLFVKYFEIVWGDC